MLWIKEEMQRNSTFQTLYVLLGSKPFLKENFFHGLIYSFIILKPIVPKKRKLFPE